QLPDESKLERVGVQAHFLGQYIAWDSHHNARVAMANGMTVAHPSEANFWPWENLDNAQTGLHDYLMFRKYGYGRGCTQISVDVRCGLYSPDFARGWVSRHDGLFPVFYAGVSLQEVLDRIGVSVEELHILLDRFTNWHLFRRVVDQADAAPILIG
ncbi:MAG: hypothetical protein ACREO9_04720, partial [Lysobacterales bacterium]